MFEIVMVTYRKMSS